MNISSAKPIAFLASALLFGLSASSRAESPPTLTAISPVFSQLVRFSMPGTFVVVFESAKGDFYIREAVLKGESARQWSQMITITGARGLAKAPNYAPQVHAGGIAEGFRKACPDSFAARGVGATKLGEQDAYVAVAGCGKVGAGADAYSEIALIIAIKGNPDAYTIQWAERRSASSTPIIEEVTWQGRLRDLMEIRLCAIVPGEAAPYPSCLKQK
jgi:hypothetical protein